MLVPSRARPLHTKATWFAVLAVLLGFWGLGGAASYAQPHDPCANYRTLVPGKPLQSSDGYRPRGVVGKEDRRCEGVYEPDQAATTLALRSLTLGPIAFDPQQSDPILVVLPTLRRPLSGDIWLRATSLGLAFRYQLDTLIPDTGTFSWPTQPVLKEKNILPATIGIVARSVTDVPIFVPVQVGAGGPAAAATLKAQLLAVQPLFRLRWRIGDQVVSDAGNECDSKEQWQFYGSDIPSLTPIDIEILPRATDVACLEIGFKRTSRATWRPEVIWIGMPK